MDCCKLVIALILGVASTGVLAAETDDAIPYNKTNFYLDFLYLQPNSNNLKYAVIVSGTQPYYQSWHNQTINPDYSPAFELGFQYALKQTPYNFSIDWLHLGASNSSSAQVNRENISNVEFVAPPYDVGPAVFGIKHAESTLSSSFNDVELNVGKVFNDDSCVTGRFFAGLAVLNLNQTLSTTFSDYAGYVAVTGQAYALPPDPDFYFTTKNYSKYLGIGPDIGVDLQAQNRYGLGIFGQFMGELTTGTISAGDNFTSASRRLIALGINPSTQAITAPNTNQLVPGIKAKLGVSYTHAWHDYNVTAGIGYFFAYFYNAISTYSPDTLVQAGVDPSIPEFATGTMAINSTTTSNSPFSLRGAFLNVTVGLV